MKRLFYLAVALMCAISVTAAQPVAATARPAIGADSGNLRS